MTLREIVAGTLVVASTLGLVGLSIEAERAHHITGAKFVSAP